LSEAGSELIVKQASKSNNAIVVGASTEYTKGPYQKRKPSVDGEVDETKDPKRKRSRGPGKKNIERHARTLEERPLPLLTMEPVSFKPFNQDTIVQALINQAAMECAADNEQKEPEFESPMAVMKDPRVAGFLMEMEASHALPSNEVQDTSNSEVASNTFVVRI
jgi:hypothetical protein